MQIHKFHFYLFIGLILMMSSCGTFSKAQTLDTETGYFPAKKNKRVTVLKEVKVNPDTLKTLLIVAKSEYNLAMGRNLNYFNEVRDIYDLEIQIMKVNMLDKTHTYIGPEGLKKAAEIYKPFVILETTKTKKGDRWFAGLVLYDALSAETIFENEIRLNLMWDGWTDQGTMFPLYNSLLNYLNKQ